MTATPEPEWAALHRDIARMEGYLRDELDLAHRRAYDALMDMWDLRGATDPRPSAAMQAAHSLEAAAQSMRGVEAFAALLAEDRKKLAKAIGK